MGLAVDAQLSGVDDTLLGGPTAPRQHGIDTQHELANAEGLHDVVRPAPSSKPTYSIDLLGSRRSP